MNFSPQQLFHIYNQGNNRKAIFFSDQNYEYFIWKMRAYLLPFGDFIAWCLMPNHFHWLFYVKKVELKRSILREHSDQVEYLRRKHKFGINAKNVDPATSSRTADSDSPITLNNAIGMIQNTYTRAINKERGWTGSLFRKECKAKDGWIDEFITLKKPDGNLDYRFMPGSGYAYNCFTYIHNNPVQARLVKNNTDWVYSSAKDYSGLRNGTLCNLDMGRELMNFL